MATDPGTHEPPPKKSNTIWWVLGCGALIIIGGLIASPFLCCGGGMMWLKGEVAKREKMVDEDAGVPVSAEDLEKAYAENTGTADTKYKDKVLVVTGKVQSASADSITFDTSSVTVPPGKLTLGISCTMADKNKGQLAGVKTGDNIKVKGYCTGQGILGISLSACKIEK
jgi:hypothetical protein